MGSGGGPVCTALCCAPSALRQIVPISASIYTVFHSVIFNSVVCPQGEYISIDGIKTLPEIFLW